MQVASYRPVTLKGGNDKDSRILQEYAEFWKIPYRLEYSEGQDSVVLSTLATELSQAEDHRSLIIAPAQRLEAEKVALETGVTVTSEKKLVRLPVGRNSTVSLSTELYQFSGAKIEPIISAESSLVLSKIKTTNVYLLGIDLVRQYSRIIYDGLEEIPSRLFSLVTGLPFSYKAIPSFIRNRSFRSKSGTSELREENLGAVEFLRTAFLASIVVSGGPIPRIGFWRRGKTYAASVTHDVETEEGLNSGALNMKEVEERLRIRSTWNVPSDRYPLSKESLHDIGSNGEIGAHDTKHDGRLAFLDIPEKTRRLENCKERLERATGENVRGFRAPLLQHSKSLMVALSDAGYDFDSSCPSWEILSPTSRRPHGVGTVFPFSVGNILEIPVSLPQDHQLIRVAGLQPSEAVDLVLQLSKWIRTLSGVCVLLTHPDYEFAVTENKEEYSRLLEAFVSDPECDLMTLGEMADWWNIRAGARIQIDSGRAVIVAPNEHAGAALQGQVVTGYDANGFSVVSFS